MDERLDILENTRRLRQIIEVERTVTLWTVEHTVVPRLVSRVFGDGRFLFELRPIMTRPNYYVIRGDSSWRDEHGWPSDSPVRQVLDDIYDAIEDEYGCADQCHDDCPEDCPGGDHEEPLDWPAFRCDGGTEWMALDDDLARELDGATAVAGPPGTAP